jgi:hypothetical protein
MKALCLLLIVMNIAVALWEYRHNNPLSNNADNSKSNKGESIVLVDETKSALLNQPAKQESDTPKAPETRSP